jgi:ornithine decarboxylase
VTPDLEAIFATINRVTSESFGADRPALVCEPGRGLCGDAFAVGTRVKGYRDQAHVFLNDGIYGSLFEFSQIGIIDRIQVMDATGNLRTGAVHGKIVFGPTCDSVDRLPGDVPLPDDIAEGDFVVFQGMGAYSTVTNSRFNGFGDLARCTVLSLKL